MKNLLPRSLVVLSLISLFAIGHDNGTNLYNVNVSSSTPKVKEVNRAGEKPVLKVYNSQDYILYDEETDSYPLIDQFEELYDCKVIYENFDTNENMLSQVKLGANSYDLICTSEYTVQRMIQEDLIIPFEENGTPNYDAYASRFLIEKLAGIEINGHTGVMDKYARGYMWGTLGYLYNPDYVGYNDEIRETIHEDMNDWESLWNPKYESSFYLKDSIRDTYALGVMHAFKDELNEQKALYEAEEIDAVTYNKVITEIFNRCDQDSANKVFDALKELNSNGASFEIDEGKTDMVKGYIGIDLAWSGDAIYAMDIGEEAGVTLYYQAPELAANIWFDAWVLPKGSNVELAQHFVDFLADPWISVENSDYIGYTSFIAGDALVDYILENYDVTDDETIPEEDKFVRDIGYIFEGTLENYTLDDCVFMIDEEHTFFDTSYPAIEDLPHLCVMRDFGENLSIVTAGWEQFRGQEIPVWAYAVFGAAVGLVIIGIVVYKVRQKQIIKQRKARRAAAK